MNKLPANEALKSNPSRATAVGAWQLEVIVI